MSAQEELITDLPNPSELSLDGIFGEINQLGNKIESGQEVPPADRARLASLMREVHGRHKRALAKIDDDYGGDASDRDRKTEIDGWLATMGPVLNHINAKAALWGFTVSIENRDEEVAGGQATGADEAGVQVETSAATAAAADQARADLAKQLEPQLAELRAQQEKLQTTITELGADNKRLGEANVELNGTNTELERRIQALETTIQSLTDTNQATETAIHRALQEAGVLLAPGQSPLDGLVGLAQKARLADTQQTELATNAQLAEMQTKLDNSKNALLDALRDIIAGREVDKETQTQLFRLFGQEITVLMNQIAAPSTGQETLNTAGQLANLVAALKSMAEGQGSPAVANQLTGDPRKAFEAIQALLQTASDQRSIALDDEIRDRDVVQLDTDFNEVLTIATGEFEINGSKMNTELLRQKLNDPQYPHRASLVYEIFKVFKTGVDQLQNPPSPFKDIEYWNKLFKSYLRTIGQATHPDKIRGNMASLEPAQAENIAQLQVLVTDIAGLLSKPAGVSLIANFVIKNNR